MSAISPSIQAVVELFEGSLSEVRFADIDAATLRQRATEVEAATAEFEAKQAALEAARQALLDRQEQLSNLAQRALAYARVFAENDDDLTARLAAIQLPKGGKRGKTDKLGQSSDSTEAASSARTSPEAPKRAPRKGSDSRTVGSPGAPDASSGDAADGTASAAEAPDRMLVSDVGESNEWSAPATSTAARRGKKRDSARSNGAEEDGL